MNNHLPRYTSAAQKGEAGVGLVSRIVTDEFGWIFRRNHQEHDFGIDGHLEVITEDGFVTGQMLAVQIKYGASFFKEKNNWGYTYRGELKHFNYLANYPLPILIVICNPESRECFWVKFDVESTTRTSKGWKFTVPFENVLRKSKPELLSMLLPSTDSLSELEEYWKVNELMADSEHIFFIIDKLDVEAFDVEPPRNFFDRLRKTKELAFACQGKVDIMFSGYDDDHREIYEITEVREYVQMLSKVLIELFFFGRTKGKHPSLPSLAMCLTNVTVPNRRVPVGEQMKVTFETKLIGDFLHDQFLGLNEMTEWLDMTMEQNKEISLGAVRCLGFEPSAESNEA